MKFEYTLNENDYLTNSLFTASQSPTIKKRRFWMRFSIPVAYVILGIWMYNEYRPESAIIFFVLAVLWFFISPALTRRRYVRYYKIAIKEAYGKRIGRPCSLQIGEDELIYKEEPNECRVKLSDIEKICELNTHFFIRQKTSNTVILPKDKIKDTEALKAELKELAIRLNLPYTAELDWKWQ